MRLVVWANSEEGSRPSRKTKIQWLRDTVDDGAMFCTLYSWRVGIFISYAETGVESVEGDGDMPMSYLEETDCQAQAARDDRKHNDHGARSNVSSIR